MKYKNPVLFSDYSDPDVIRVGQYFYLVASSFNFVPCVPVLRSRNLVEWEHVNYVADRLPFGEFDGCVRHGEGVWAPSLRYRDGRFYCIMPIYGRGIYVSEAQSAEGEWSPLRLLIDDPGVIDPCPIWVEDRCYLAVAFARSKAGFNSVIALYEVSPDLTSCLSDGYRIIYDGHDVNPVIEGPKLYKRGKYFYILAPAGSVRSGWQTALRSLDIYGPYESKIVLMQDDTPINGPHQGALVDCPDGRDMFVHFQDMRVYGRVVHLQPVTWQDGWPLCGAVKYDGLAGKPTSGGDYPVDVSTGACVPLSDDFSGDRLSPLWQTPSNMQGDWYSLGGGLSLNCVHFGCAVCDLPNLFTTKLAAKNFSARCSLTFMPDEEGDEAGFGVVGEKYAFVKMAYSGGAVRLYMTCDGEEKLLGECPRAAEMEIVGTNRNIYELWLTFFVNGAKLGGEYRVSAGRWVGARLALFGRNASCGGSSGRVLINSFKVTKL